MLFRSEVFDFTRILERILGSTGSLVLDLSSIKNQKPLMRIEIQNDDTKEFEILIFAIENELAFQEIENEAKKEESFIVIPPNLSRQEASCMPMFPLNGIQ